MLFNSLPFAVFLPVVFAVYWSLRRAPLRVQNLFVLCASYFFYGWWDWRFLSLLWLSTIVDYSVSPTAIAGTWRLENDGGVWDGDWTGVIESDGLHSIEGAMAGSRGYDGLVYRATWEYYNDGDITAGGVIEPAP